MHEKSSFPVCKLTYMVFKTSTMAAELTVSTLRWVWHMVVDYVDDMPRYRPNVMLHWQVVYMHARVETHTSIYK